MVSSTGSVRPRSEQPRSAQRITIPRAPSPSPSSTSPTFTFSPSPSSANPFSVPRTESRPVSRTSSRAAYRAASPASDSPPAYPAPSPSPSPAPAEMSELPASPRLRYSPIYSDTAEESWKPADSKRHANLIRKCLGGSEPTNDGDDKWEKPRSDARLKTELAELLENLLPLTSGQMQLIRPYLDFVDPKEYTCPSATDGTDMKAFKRALEGLLMGPVEFDVWMLHEAFWSGNIKDKDNLVMLQLALLGRENGDLLRMKRAYQNRYRKRENTNDSTGSGKSAGSKLGTWRIGGGTTAGTSASFGDLNNDWKVQGASLKSSEPALHALFDAIIGGTDIDTDYQFPSTAEMAEVNSTKALEVKREIETEVDDLRLALTSKPSGNDLKKIATILGRASRLRVNELVDLFDNKYKSLAVELSTKVEKKDPAVYDMLQYIILGAADPDRRDARFIESTMEGAGTRELQLACRIVKCRWRTKKVAKAWETTYPLGLKRKKNLMKYEKSLEARIQREVSGLLKDLLMGILETERRGR